MRASRGRRRSAVAGLALPVLAALALPATASAGAWLTVDCSGATPGAFMSIRAALDSLTGPPPPEGDYDYVALMGDCTESVTVSGRRRVWIGPEWDMWHVTGSETGPLARIISAVPASRALSVTASEVTLAHLELTGGYHGLAIGGGSDVTTYGVLVAGNSDSGVAVTGGSHLIVNESRLLDNGAFGIHSTGGSSVDLWGETPWFRGEPLVVTGNAAGGLYSERSHLGAANGVTIAGNGGPALLTYGGHTTFGAFITESVIRDNAAGVVLGEGSEASFWGRVAIRANGPFGIRVDGGGHVTLIQTAPEFAVTVEGHSGIGVDVTSRSQATFRGANRIRDNGSPAEPWSAGVRVGGNSQACFDQGNQVSSNTGPGIAVDVNSSVEVLDGAVSANSSEGVRVGAMSVASFGRTASLEGNRRGALRCDTTSLVLARQFAPTRLCARLGPARLPERPCRVTAP